MSNKLYEENDIQNIANAIRNKNGTEDPYKVSQMSTAINSIEVIEQATAEGESLSLTNTKAMPYSDYVVEGKSEQETRSGKNKFNYASASDTNNTFLSTYRLFEISGLKANSVYNINNISFNSLLSGKYCYIWKTNTYPGGIATILANPNEYYNQKVFETNEEGKVYLAMYPDDTTTWNNIIPYLQYAQIEEGRETTSYEPYGVSPSPEYPSEIHSVADDVNLFDASKIANSSISVTDNGKTIIMPLFTSGGGYTSTNTKLSVLCPDLKVGDIAFLHFIKNISGSYNNYIYLVGSNRAWQKDTYATITQSDLDSTVIMYANDYAHGETEQLIITDFKIQKGTTSTPYSPYNQGTVTIKQRGTTESNDYTIQTEPLRSLPNGVKDTIEEDGIHRRVGRVILDGSNDENWYYVSQSHSVFYIDNITQPYSNNEFTPYCNYFKGTTKSTGASSFAQKGNNLITFLQDANIKRIMITDDDYSNASNFKTWLSTHNIEVLYELATETIEPFTQQQATTYLDIIKTGSYEGTTNIYTDEDVKPTIEVDYYKKV